MTDYANLLAAAAAYIQLPAAGGIHVIQKLIDALRESCRTQNDLRVELAFERGNIKQLNELLRRWKRCAGMSVPPALLATTDAFLEEKP